MDVGRCTQCGCSLLPSTEDPGNEIDIDYLRSNYELLSALCEKLLYIETWLVRVTILLVVILISLGMILRVVIH